MSIWRSPDIEPTDGSVPARLAALSLFDAVDLDARPTFAIDLDAANVPLELAYCNPALAQAVALLAKIGGQDTDRTMAASSDSEQTNANFRAWVLGSADVPNDDSACHGNAYLFAGYIWAATTLGRLKLVSGVQHLWPRAGRSYSSPPKHSSAVEKVHTRPRERPQMKIVPMLPAPTTSPTVHLASYDPTLDPPPANMSDHVRYFSSVDWAQTVLGPMSSWSPQLRCVVNMIMNDSHPAIVFWGQHDVAMIYNAAYVDIIGSMHPCMGASARVVAKEYWVHFQPLVDHIDATGQTLSEKDMLVFIDRHGFLEEAFFSFQLIPILDGTGHVAGYYQPLVETTMCASVT
jgi:hypothetical protein